MNMSGCHLLIAYGLLTFFAGQITTGHSMSFGSYCLLRPYGSLLYMFKKVVNAFSLNVL